MTSRELRLAAGGILQAIAAPDDLDTARLALVALHERYSCSLRAHAAQALRTIAGPRGACNGAILAGLSDLVRTSDFPEVRCEAVQLLGQLDDFGGDAGMTACTAALDDAEEEAFFPESPAQSDLGPHIGRPEPLNPSQASEEALRGLLAKLAPDACFGQLRCDILLVLPRLAVYDRSRTASAAAACLLDPDLSVSNAAVQAIRKLCQRGDATLEEELLRYAAHEDLEIRRTVVELLGLVASRGSPGEALLKSLQHEDEDAFRLGLNLRRSHESWHMSANLSWTLESIDSYQSLDVLLSTLAALEILPLIGHCDEQPDAYREVFGEVGKVSNCGDAAAEIKAVFASHLPQEERFRVYPAETRGSGAGGWLPAACFLLGSAGHRAMPIPDFPTLPPLPPVVRHPWEATWWVDVLQKLGQEFPTADASDQDWKHFVVRSSTAPAVVLALGFLLTLVVLCSSCCCHRQHSRRRAPSCFPSFCLGAMSIVLVLAGAFVYWETSSKALDTAQHQLTRASNDVSTAKDQGTLMKATGLAMMENLQGISSTCPPGTKTVVESYISRIEKQISSFNSATDAFQKVVDPLPEKVGNVKDRGSSIAKIAMAALLGPLALVLLSCTVAARFLQEQERITKELHHTKELREQAYRQLKPFNAGGVDTGPTAMELSGDIEEWNEIARELDAPPDGKADGPLLKLMQALQQAGISTESTMPAVPATPPRRETQVPPATPPHATKTLAQVRSPLSGGGTPTGEEALKDPYLSSPGLAHFGVHSASAGHVSGAMPAAPMASNVEAQRGENASGDASDAGDGATSRLVERLSEKRRAKRSALAPFGVVRTDQTDKDTIEGGVATSPPPTPSMPAGKPVSAIMSDDDSEELDTASMASPGLTRLE
eukprot:s1273_g10.t1